VVQGRSTDLPGVGGGFRGNTGHVFVLGRESFLGGGVKAGARSPRCVDVCVKRGGLRGDSGPCVL
jgi:hypothetical protein